jgi:hypothetical protein
MKRRFGVPQCATIGASGFLLVWAANGAIHRFVEGSRLTDKQIREFREHASKRAIATA